MRTFTLLLLVLLVNFSQAADAQKISLSEQNSPLRTVLEKIKKQTGYSLFYVKEHLKEARPVTLQVRDASLKSCLDIIFADQPLSYDIENNVIIVRKKEVVQPVAVAEVIAHGRVMDEEGKPLAGAGVSIKGSKKGVVTDEKGEFTIHIDAGDVLVVSYVGYEPREMPYRNAAVLDIRLKKQDNNLTDFVVIGYGAVSQKNTTGAIATVKSKDLSLGTSSNFAQNLQGKAAGIQVTQATGQPGANAVIQIRSNPSPNDPGVLYVIDGIPVNSGAAQPGMTGTIGANKYGAAGVDQSPMNFINPNDIQSIEFLKDPSSTAIYGARAGSGVVLITTKKGSQKQSRIEYTGSYGIQQVDKMYPIYGAKDYMIQRNLLAEQVWYRNNGIAPYFGSTDAGSVTPFSPIYSQAKIDSAASNTENAMNAIVQHAFTQQHNLSLAGGNGKTTYFASGNYFTQKGVIIGTDYVRYNGRLNLEHAVSDKIKIGASVLVSGSTSHNTITGGSNEDGGIITAAVYWAPVVPLKNADGSYPISPYYPNIPNPLSYGTVTNKTLFSRTLSSAFGEWKIISGLTARAQFSYDQSSAKTSSYLPTTFLFGEQVNGEASIDETDAFQRSMIYTLTYNKSFGARHSLNAVVAYDYESGGGSSLSAANQNFLSDALSYYNLGAGQAARPSVGSGEQAPLTSESLVGRAIYTYNNEITIQGSIRKDGLSTFAAGKKWGYFPGISAGWLLSNEPFIQHIKLISYLKLRAGYGETGNPLTSASAFQLYGTPLSPYFGSGAVNTAIRITQAANPDLTWETRAGFDGGVDFGLFDSRLTGTVDYFNTTNRNLIKYVMYPVGFPIGGVYINAGKTKSEGYEISLQSRNIVGGENGGFSWSTTVNFAHYLNYWVARAPQDLATLGKYETPTGKKALYNPVYGYLSNGIFADTYGKAPAQMPGMLPGGLIIKDIHGYDASGNLTGPDGVITAADYTLLGNADPRFNFGIGNQFSFKGVDLSIFLSGMIQRKWSPLDGGRAQENTMNAFGFNAIPTPSPAWSTHTTNGAYPTELNDGTYSQFQSAANYWWVNASYLRCKDIVIGYTLPKKLLSKQSAISAVRISFDMQNLFTITNYPGLDPELNSNNFYPLVKSYVFGVNLSF
ncbi:MAG TPA: SusC/RagA family TonB-linked outer membrane protein [Puia sp.]|nr:SusC/RagA family TonB-linked outer membrane protein [Puia sp.]